LLMTPRRHRTPARSGSRFVRMLAVLAPGPIWSRISTDVRRMGLGRGSRSTRAGLGVDSERYGIVVGPFQLPFPIHIQARSPLSLIMKTSVCDGLTPNCCDTASADPDGNPGLPIALIVQ